MTGLLISSLLLLAFESGWQEKPARTRHGFELRIEARNATGHVLRLGCRMGNGTAGLAWIHPGAPIPGSGTTLVQGCFGSACRWFQFYRAGTELTLQNHELPRMEALMKQHRHIRLSHEGRSARFSLLDFKNQRNRLSCTTRSRIP